MKTFGGVEVRVNSFLISVLDGVYHVIRIQPRYA
jgi:hypothetical protein